MAAPDGASVDVLASSVTQADDFRDGAFPEKLVAGRAIVRLHAMTADHVATTAGTTTLKEIESRTQVGLQLVRPLFLGWGLYNVTDLSGTNAHKELSEADTLALIARLDADVAVKVAQEDRWYRPLRAPNDALYDNMWHFDIIGMEAAWDLTIGETSQRVGVVDTGLLRNHPDLNSKDVNGYDFISSANQAADNNGRDANYTDAGDAADCGQGFQPS